MPSPAPPLKPPAEWIAAAWRLRCAAPCHRGRHHSQRLGAETMDGLDTELRALAPPTDFSRRGFLTTSLIAGFTLATGPVNAQSVITTDAAGLEAGEVKLKTRDGEIPAYRAMPASGASFPT